MSSSHSHSGEMPSNTVMDLLLEMLEFISGKTISEALPKMAAWLNNASNVDVEKLKIWCDENAKLPEDSMSIESHQGNAVLDSFEDIMQFIASVINTFLAGDSLSSHLGISMHDASTIPADGGVAGEVNIAEFASALLG